MNKIEASVTEIQSMDNLTLVAFESQGNAMQMMSLGLNTPLQIGSRVVLGAKASSIAIATDLSTTISISNQLECVVDSLKQGEFLCSVKLRFNNAIIESVITMKSVLKMDINVGDSVIALIKASELSILEVQGE